MLIRLPEEVIKGVELGGLRLLQCISVFKGLQELCCLNCRLSPRALFNAISESLPALTRLEWSLFDDDAYKQITDAMICVWVTVWNLRYMYVEIAANRVAFALLITGLCCPRLDEMHVHNIGTNQLVAIDIFCRSLRDRGEIRVFTYTSRETDRRTMSFACACKERDKQTSSNRRLSALLCGNAAYRMQPTSYSNCLYLPELIAAPERMDQNLRQAILCVTIDDNTPAELEQVAHRSLWGRLEALTIALVPSNGYVGSPYIPPAYISPLNALLGACSVLSELNVNSVHFTEDTDCCKILSALGNRQLRAISIAACGTQSPVSICQLAVSFPNLEQLDVRSCHDVVGPPCGICRSPFDALNEETMAVLHQETRLSNLVLNVYELHSLNFLENCRVQRLGVLWRGDVVRCAGHRSIGQLLRENLHLRSLSFVCCTVAVETLCSELGLGVVPTLQSLCIVSNVQEKRARTERAVLVLARSHPSLAVLHVHYVSEKSLNDRITWIRRWRDNVLYAQPQVPDDDVFLPDGPCILDCHMSTYIGLLKPHNQTCEI
ncbi:hypothetical protein HPB48_002419 [Haemaphysalis longicornis]|uniref:Uncharacterized protein n=1 Tax=Haemaphysalis longicornis TaxID=44386 RepID=A0A9J6FE32_HAELO|nr:hypothetical protein HPB48_002419 [Haemaphysalis longicornis]